MQKIKQLWMTSCQISLAARHLFLAFVFQKQEIWSEGTYYIKKFKCSRPLTKLQRCVAFYLKSSINLLRRLLKEACWTSQLAMFVWQKFKTLCWLSNWIQRRIQKNAGSVERRGELRRSKRKLQPVIKVSFWRLYNVYNQQDQTFVFNNRVVDKA